jgi:hypothetical protein
MFSPDVFDPTVDFLARLAGDRRALEFAVGTGRVALALNARGVDVAGIELSRARSSYRRCGGCPSVRRSSPPTCHTIT